MSGRTVRIGTRGSQLSLWQARWVAERLGRALPGRGVELVPMTTRGDRHVGSFDGVSERGLFTSDVEAALLAGEVDVAVHSLKDLPVDPAAVRVVAVPPREDPRDAVVSRQGLALADLPTGARVGTSSPRRACLVSASRPDLSVLPLRGNVDSRVRQLDEGRFDAVILAAAGLVRLGLDARITERLDARAYPPAPGQGALAVQAREDDEELLAAVRALDDADARATTSAERLCLAGLGGGCSLPIGTHARRTPSGALDLTAFVGSVDGARILRAEATGNTPEEVGRAAADSLLAQGARELLA